MSGLLERIGLGRAELRAWAMYDWANSAFMTTIVAAVFPIYFSRVAAGDLQPAEATGRFALATTVALSIVAVLSPFLGALADCSGSKKTPAWRVHGARRSGHRVHVLHPTG